MLQGRYGESTYEGRTLTVSRADWNKYLQERSKREAQ
jgi:hypothetical protein